MSLKHIHDPSLVLLGTGTAIKIGEVKLILFAGRGIKISPLSE
jgi:hypothetical protein